VKLGLNLLVMSGFVTLQDRPILKQIKQAGFDGVELPVFSGNEKDYSALGRLLDELALARTFVTIIPDNEHNPLSPDPSIRARAGERLRWAIDCGHALGATVMCGPFHSPLGVFSGHGPTVDELQRLADVLRTTAETATAAGIKLSIEPLNRFECYVLNTLDQASALRERVGHPNFSLCTTRSTRILKNATRSGRCDATGMRSATSTSRKMIAAFLAVGTCHGGRPLTKGG
jgi:D-psicose/D-tagatose/L-ribulose 3-epimerase